MSFICASVSMCRDVASGDAAAAGCRRSALRQEIKHCEVCKPVCEDALAGG